MCTSILIGKNAFYKNTAVIARNEDCAENVTCKLMRPMHSPFYSALRPGDIWTLENGLKVPVPDKAYKYCSIPDSSVRADTFEERGINEKGVAMSATNSMGISNKALRCDPVAGTGIEESIIVTLILPQIDSALQGVELLGEYVEKYGASEANGISFADADEAWYMEIGSGHHWIAVRVPDDCYLFVANSMRIHDVDLNDTRNVRCSKGLYEFTKSNKLLEAPDKENFNFSAAFGFQGKMDDPQGNPYYNADRIWLAQYILNPDKFQAPRDMLGQYPLFLEPESKITLDTVTKILRADYKGTELEDKAERLIGTVKTMESHIIFFDKKLSEEIPSCTGGVIWQSIGTPVYSRYMCVIPEITEFTPPYHDDTDGGVFWTVQLIAACCSALGQGYANKIKREIKKCEENYFNRYYELTENYSGDDLVRMLTKYCGDSLENNVCELNSLRNQCLKQFINSGKDLV